MAGVDPLSIEHNAPYKLLCTPRLRRIPPGMSGTPRTQRTGLGNSGVPSPTGLKYTTLNASPAITNLERLQTVRQRPTLSGPGAPGTGTLLRIAGFGGALHVLSPMLLCPGARGLPQRKDPGDHLRGTCAHLHVCLRVCAHPETAEKKKICEAVACTEQCEISFAASREALGPGIVLPVASTVIYRCVYVSSSDSFQHRWLLLRWTKM